MITILDPAQVEQLMSFASSCGHPNIVKPLLKHGARVCPTIEAVGIWPGDPTTALWEACSAGHLSVAEVLIENGADIYRVVFSAPILAAAYQGHPIVVDFWLNNGANPDARDGTGRTACHWAAGCGSLDSVKRLLDAHRDQELKDGNGQTALHRAANGGDLDKGHCDVIEELLLDRWADVSVKDKEDKSARGLLLKNRSEDVGRVHELLQRLLQVEQNASSLAADDR